MQVRVRVDGGTIDQHGLDPQGLQLFERGRHLRAHRLHALTAAERRAACGDHRNGFRFGDGRQVQQFDRGIGSISSLIKQCCVVGQGQAAVGYIREHAKRVETLGVGLHRRVKFVQGCAGVEQRHRLVHCSAHNRFEFAGAQVVHHGGEVTFGGQQLKGVTQRGHGRLGRVGVVANLVRDKTPQLQGQRLYRIERVVKVGGAQAGVVHAKQLGQLRGCHARGFQRREHVDLGSVGGVRVGDRRQRSGERRTVGDVVTARNDQL